MNGTYKAVDVSASGEFCVVERAIAKPAAGDDGAGRMGSMADRGHRADEPDLTSRALMNSEGFSATDQEGKSMAQHLASAERELSAFVTAVHQLFGPEQARYAADNWMEELEQADWINEAQAINWRAVTIAAAARLVGCVERMSAHGFKFFTASR